MILNTLARIATCFAAFFCVSIVVAQPQPAESPSPAGNPAGPLGGLLPTEAIQEQAPFLAAAFSEFFTDSRDYSAQAHLILPGRERSDSIPIGLAVSEGRMRWQLNLDRVRSAYLSPERIAMMKAMQMDSVIVWLKPDEDLTLALPRLKAWAKSPVPKPQGIQDEALDKVGGMKKTAVGKETIDGHPCVKYMLTIPEENNPDQVALTWEATDLENLPIKVLVKTDRQVHGFQLRNVRLGKVDDRFFQPPADYSKRESVGALLQEGLLRGMAQSAQGAGGLQGALSAE